jgi:hypothetical protein
MRIAHLATADRIGFELFEFEGHKAPEDNLNFRQHGTFHFAIQDPNLRGSTGKNRCWRQATHAVREYFPTRNHIAWFTSKTRLGSSLNSTVTAKN